MQAFGIVFFVCKNIQIANSAGFFEGKKLAIIFKNIAKEKLLRILFVNIVFVFASRNSNQKPEILEDSICTLTIIT